LRTRKKIVGFRKGGPGRLLYTLQEGEEEEKEEEMMN
jgi:hypothetical protein